MECALTMTENVEKRDNGNYQKVSDYRVLIVFGILICLIGVVVNVKNFIASGKAISLIMALISTMCTLINILFYANNSRKLKDINKGEQQNDKN